MASETDPREINQSDDDAQRQRMKDYVQRWKHLGPLLEAQREEDVRQADTFSAFSFFAGMPLHNLSEFPAEPTSGLVQQQQWFRKLHAS